MKQKKNKRTSEKPISLSPLEFKKAIDGLLKVKPNEKDGEKEKDSRSNQKD